MSSAQRKINTPRTLRIELGDASPEQVRDIVEQLLSLSGLSQSERIQLLGSAFVTECLESYWNACDSADGAHAALRADDPALADAVEALAPVLYSRAAVVAVEDLLGLRGR